MPITWHARRPTSGTVYNRSGNPFTVTRSGVSHAGIDVLEVAPSSRPDAHGRVVRACDVTTDKPKEA